MKFKFKPEKSNLFFMSSILILCLMTCYFWLSFKEYTYFTIYFLLTIFISIIYYFQSYIIKENYFIIRVFFVNTKFKYSNIKKVEEYKGGVKIFFKNMSFVIYPNSKDIFMTKINSKINK